MLAKYNHYPLMDNSRVFTSLALMQLLLEPVAFFITASSGLMSAIAASNGFEYTSTLKITVIQETLNHS